MDKTLKFLLGVIAVSLVMLNLQLAGVELVSEAHAEIGANGFSGIERQLSSISMAIHGIRCN